MSKILNPKNMVHLPTLTSTTMLVQSLGNVVVTRDMEEAGLFCEPCGELLRTGNTVVKVEIQMYDGSDPEQAGFYNVTSLVQLECLGHFLAGQFTHLVESEGEE